MSNPDDPIRDELARLRAKNERLLRQVLGQPDPDDNPPSDDNPPAAA